MISEVLEVRRADALERSEVGQLARDPEAMAMEVIDNRVMVKYLTYSVCILGFFVWLLIMSRR